MEMLKFLGCKVHFLLCQNVQPVVLKKTRKTVLCGLPETERQFFRKKNKVFSCQYKGQNRHGEELVFLNGKLYSKTMWDNGTKNGFETIYYSNGRKLSEGCWGRGTRQGIWNFWYSDDNKAKEIVWYYGEVIKRSFWSRQGKLMYSCEYKWGRKHGLEKKWVDYTRCYELRKYDQDFLISSEFAQR
ncbi:MORN repeat-containing protein [Noumeavirus]|uniref:MORN repeat-containing protein n=1 Tax=Noumeavirus TaxID=1955558 RepID=UPI000982E9FB|nr:MORN repeat-containing protein [Noumeavirus]AQM73196.1 MORN repeat-containing protein [Noumeavirus]AQQ73688.1 hypothetical protein [Kurlavirus BKC-1]